MDALIASPKLTELLAPYETIQEIIHQEDSYLVVTEENQLMVEVIYDDSSFIGPRKFSLKFYDPVPLEPPHG